MVRGEGCNATGVSLSSSLFLQSDTHRNEKKPADVTHNTSPSVRRQPASGIHVCYLLS